MCDVIDALATDHSYQFHHPIDHLGCTSLASASNGLQPLVNSHPPWGPPSLPFPSQVANKTYLMFWESIEVASPAISWLF